MEQGIPPLPTQPVVHVGIELQDSIKVTIQNKKKTQTQYFDWEVPPRVSSVWSMQGQGMDRFGHHVMAEKRACRSGLVYSFTLGQIFVYSLYFYNFESFTWSALACLPFSTIFHKRVHYSFYTKGGTGRNSQQYCYSNSLVWAFFNYKRNLFYVFLQTRFEIRKS